jgi:antirestriction protein
MVTTGPRIYVACLASYNNGTLHGEWIDANQDEDAIRGAIADMLSRSPFPNVTVDCPDCHGAQGDPLQSAGGVACERCNDTGKVPSAEEWAIHDFEVFGGLKLSEHEDLATVVALAELVEEHGEDVVAAAGDVCSSNEEIADAINNRYRGAYDEPADYAEEIMTDIHDMSEVPDFIRYHIDWQGVARDMELGGDVSFIRRGGQVHVFDNNA